MATVTTRFQCSSCGVGIVKLIVKNRGGNIDVETKNCDNKKCNASFGLSGISKLERIPENYGKKDPK